MENEKRSADERAPFGAQFVERMEYTVGGAAYPATLKCVTQGSGGCTTDAACDTDMAV